MAGFPGLTAHPQDSFSVPETCGAEFADLMLYFWLVPLLVWLFLLGAAVGSFLNVCIARLGRAKSLVWPDSRCGVCYHQVRLAHNIPLVSYWWLGGRCRDCGTTFTIRYFLVELFTALAFVALYLVEIGFNLPGYSLWDPDGFLFLERATFPPRSWDLYLWHASLASLLIAATGGLLEFGRIAPGVTVVGWLLGLIGAMLFPWPYPAEPKEALLGGEGPSPQIRRSIDGGETSPWRGPMPRDREWATWPWSPRPGFMAWPVWGPPTEPLPPGSWRLGLVTGLIGGLVGAWGLRVIAWLAALGRGHPIFDTSGTDILLIAGTFLGWQPIIVALLLGTVLATPGRWGLRLLRGPELPMGFWLTVAVMIAWLGWGWIGPLVRPVFFDGMLLPLVLVGILGLVFLGNLAIRLMEAPLDKILN